MRDTSIADVSGYVAAAARAGLPTRGDRSFVGDRGRGPGLRRWLWISSGGIRPITGSSALEISNAARPKHRPRKSKDLQARILGDRPIRGTPPWWHPQDKAPSTPPRRQLCGFTHDQLFL